MNCLRHAPFSNMIGGRSVLRHWLPVFGFVAMSASIDSDTAGTAGVSIVEVWEAVSDLIFLVRGPGSTFGF
jgi:hypothetical protein